MDSMIPVVAIHLDKRRQKKDGTYPITLRIYHDGHRKYYRTGHSLTEADYQKAFSDNPTGVLLTINKNVQNKKEKAQSIINSLSQFSFGIYDKIERGENEKVSLVISESFDQYINKLQNEERVSSADSYSDAKKVFFEFISDKTKLSQNVKFGDITDSNLEKFELWMLKTGRKSGTVGVYMRNLRRLYNIAINKGVLDKSLYPFGKDKYVIPQSINKKKALSLDQIKLIYNYRCDPKTKMKRYVDFFFFSFYCKGMNLKDIAGLQWQNLNGDVINFVRAKTKRSTKQNLKTIEVELNSDALRIIKEHGVPSKDSTDYIFPIWDKSMDAVRKDKVKKYEIKNINNALKQIAKELGLSAHNLSFITARHAWASIANESGVNKIAIQEGLGHKNSKTTDNYLKSLDSKSMADFQNIIDLSSKPKMKVI